MGTEGFNQAGRASFFDPSISADYKTGLWRTCPLLEHMFDPSIGVLCREDFTTYDATATTGDYLTTQATTGTGAISTAAPGVLELDSNSATQGQGIQTQRLKAGFIPAAGKHIWFEAQIKIVDTYDDCELFVGLANSDTTLVVTQANTSTDHVGWFCGTNDGILLYQAEKGGVAVEKAAATIAEATYIKLGFYINGITSAQQYINGVAVGTAHVTANVPVLIMYPSFVCQSGGTADPIMHVQGYQVFQLR